MGDSSTFDRVLARDLTFGTACTLAVLAGIGAAHALGTPWVLLVALGLALLYVALHDIRFMLLPDAVTLPLIALGFVNVIWTGPPFLDRAIGAGVGLVILPAINWGYKRLRGRDGIGLGDAKLLAAAGSWLGWAGLPLVLLVASLAGLLAVAAVALYQRRMPRGQPIPFGPFLALGFFLMFVVNLLPNLHPAPQTPPPLF
jgi:prepilin signal peptidase PulO-like enzyme (type II secretory pathway)